MEPATKKQTLEIIGAPFDWGAGQPGAFMGPGALRTAGLVAALRKLGHQVEDLGDVANSGSVIGYPQPPWEGSHIAGWTRRLRDLAPQVLGRGAVPVYLGGDHGVSFGSVPGVARHVRQQGREIFVLWLDAHPDFHTPETTESGHLHGMPVAYFCGLPGFEQVFGDPPQDLVDADKVCLFGIRSVDPEESRQLDRHGLRVNDMRHIDRHGVERSLEPFLEQVARCQGHLHLSLDVDFLDPSIAPAVGTAVAGGANYREAHLVMELLHDSGLVGSLDVVELNPFLDVRGQTALLLVNLLESLFGRCIAGRADGSMAS